MGDPIMAKISGPNVMPDSHAVWIGRVADAWAQLEFQIDRGIWTLLRADQHIAACVTAQIISLSPRWKAFTALLEVSGASKETITKLNRFRDCTLSGLLEERNRAVHDPRMVDKATKEVHKFETVARSKIKFDFRPESPDELKRAHDLIWDAVSEFNRMRDAAIAEVEALPPESRPQLRGVVELRQALPAPDTDPQAPPSPPQSSQG
jgi:hypothetical protein